MVQIGALEITMAYIAACFSHLFAFQLLFDCRTLYSAAQLYCRRLGAALHVPSHRPVRDFLWQPVLAGMDQDSTSNSRV